MLLIFFFDLGNITSSRRRGRKSHYVEIEANKKRGI